MNMAPNQALKSLDKLVGTWKMSGEIKGHVTFEWMEGGFFLVQYVDLEYNGQKIKGAEYIGYDEKSRACTSLFFDNRGHLFTYMWEIEGDSITTWFGEAGSANRFKGKFSKDGNSYSGGWEWPGGRIRGNRYEGKVGSGKLLVRNSTNSN